MKKLSSIHLKKIHRPRVQKLVQYIHPLIASSSLIADIGCGDGLIGKYLMEQNTNLKVQGFDVSIRQNTHIPVFYFNGINIPEQDNVFDVVMLIDVLHHTDKPEHLLKEAIRISKSSIIIKDHRLSHPLAYTTLRFMDYISNKPYNVSLPYNYWSEEKWHQQWEKMNLTLSHYQTKFNLYPWPINYIFEKGLHFLARLEKK